MTNESMVSIDGLIERVRRAVTSEQNCVKGKTQPIVTFGIEEPIAWRRIFNYDVNHYFNDPLFYFEQTLHQKLWRWDNFPEDDMPITLDIPAWLGHYPEYTFVGLDVLFDSYGVPIIQADHPLSREPDLRLLKPVDFMTSGWMPRILRWYDDLNKISNGRMNVTFNMTWWRGCLDLAIQLRGYDNFMTDIVERPFFVHGLLEFLVEQRCLWWEAYYRHFGLKPEPVGIADDWLNVPFISPQIFADFVLPRYLEIEKFHGGITGIHSCGNQTPVQHYLLEIKRLSCLEVSPWTDLTQTLVNVSVDKHLAISLHPNDVLCATLDEMEARIRFIVDSCSGRSYSIGTSGLTPVSDDIGEYINKIRIWLAIARKAIDEVKAKHQKDTLMTKGELDGKKRVH